MVIRIEGDIVSNDLKEVYSWFGFDCTCPNDVNGALAVLPEGERVNVRINSGGGDLFAGQEIYSVLRGRDDVDIEIESIAGSAASIIAMAGHCTISPVGMIMIHNVSTGVYGNRRDFEKEADTLKQCDEAVAAAYVEKTGKTKEEVMRLMDRETWLTAEKAMEYGFVDGITEAATGKAAAVGNLRVTPAMIKEYQDAMKAKAAREAEKQSILDSLANYGRH